MGVQALNDTDLNFLGRVHNFNDVENGIEFVNDITDKFEKLHNRKPFKDEIEDCVNNISIDHIDSIKEEKEDTL